MRGNPLLAQATGTPGSGGSNAEDFQPPTQNPQTAPTSLQPVGDAQTAGDQSILNNQNARIIVPTGPPAEPNAVGPKHVGGSNATAILLIAALLVGLLIGALLLIQKRYSVPVPAPRPDETPTPKPLAKKKAAAAPKKTTMTNKTRKKSKSKRKKK